MSILWAVDPFCGEPEVLKSAAWALRGLTKDSSAEVLPIYALAAAPPEAAFEMNLSVRASLEARGQEELDSILARVKLPGIRPLRVLPQAAPSIRAQAEQVLKFAHEHDAGLIVLTSHGRKGL